MDYECDRLLETLPGSTLKKKAFRIVADMCVVSKKGHTPKDTKDLRMFAKFIEDALNDSDWLEAYIGIDGDDGLPLETIVNACENSDVEDIFDMYGRLFVRCIGVKMKVIGDNVSLKLQYPN